MSDVDTSDMCIMMYLINALRGTGVSASLCTDQHKKNEFCTLFCHNLILNASSEHTWRACKAINAADWERLLALSITENRVV